MMNSSAPGPDHFFADPWDSLAASVLNQGGDGQELQYSAGQELSPENLLLLEDAQRESSDSSDATSKEPSHDGATANDSTHSQDMTSGSESISIDWVSYIDSHCTNCLSDNADIISLWSAPADNIPSADANLAGLNRILTVRCSRPSATTPIFSRRGLCVLLTSNFASFLLGAGLTIWLSKRGFFLPAIQYN